MLNGLIRARSGATTMEYALIIALVLALVLTGFTGFYEAVKSLFESNAAALAGQARTSFR